MRILFVAIPDSVHTARWISQLTDQGWDLHLYPSNDMGLVHPELKNVTLHQSVYGTKRGIHESVRVRGIRTYGRWSETLARMGVRKLWPDHHVDGLVRAIQKLKPDVVHSMEIQGAGYLTLAAKERMGRGFPQWIVTNWGSDIYLFGRLADHSQRIRAVLKACDFYSCECDRDVDLARQMGFEGEVLPVLPNSGGIDLDHAFPLRAPGRTSGRRLLLLKGYQHWAGRALVGLRAIELCADELQDYRIGVYLAREEVAIAAELLRQRTGLQIELVPKCSHEEMLRLFGQARVAIGLSISDAISTSLLEAMVMGAFPIQSCTACASEWVVDGSTGFIVPPEDPEAVASAIRRAVSDDELVDIAAHKNAAVVRERVEAGLVKEKAVSFYDTVRRGGSAPAGRPRPRATFRT